MDECDDDQANCHSGTGDDFQLTGAEPTLLPSSCLVSVCPGPLCVCVLVSHGWRQGTGRPLENRPLPPHA